MDGTNGLTALDLFRQLVLATGAAAVQHEETDVASQTLYCALSNFVMLIQDESICSVNALILMALLFRGRDDSEMAWRMLAVAVPKAQAAGLDRRVPAQSQPGPTETGHRQRVNTWWSLFILDKMFSIELQRPPMIRDCFYDQEMPVTAKESHRSCFQAIVRLAKVQGQVCEGLLSCAQAEESGESTLEQVITDKIRVAAELDQLLCAWVEGLPADFRPSEYPSCDPQALPAVSFLVIQYYQTLFLIHRNSLIINPKAIRAEIDAHFADKAWRHRVLNSPSICSNVARSIVNVLNNVLGHKVNSLLNSVYAPLISVYALAIQIMKNPSGESARVDLEIQASAIRIIEQFQTKTNQQNPTIHAMVNTLHSQVASRVKESATHPTPAHSSNGGRSFGNGRAGEAMYSFPRTTLRAEQNQAPSVHAAGASTSHGIASQFDNGYLSTEPAWSGSGMDLDVFDDSLSLTEFDWDTFALTLDLPSY